MNAKVKNISLPAGLYLVSTPIGNLKDITLRALEVLKTVDIIYCEDTRTSGKLLNAYDIRTRTSVYHDHSSDSVRSRIISQIKEEGKSVALISDAGMPLISDPGHKIVQAAIEHDVPVTSLPGANAPLMALQLAGLPTDRFMFLGFLPPKIQARQNELKKWEKTPVTQIYYEAKSRVLKTLADISILYGNRKIAVARELTKKFEEVLRGSADEIMSILRAREEVKGEFVILISPYEQASAAEEEIEKAIQVLLDQNVSIKALSAEIAEVTGWAKKDIYNLALKVKEGA